MKDHELKRFRRRIVAAAAGALTVCVALCMAALCYVVVDANLSDYRATLEDASNAPFSGVSADRLDAREVTLPSGGIYPSETVWRALVNDAGEVLEVALPAVGDQFTWTPDSETTFTSKDLSELVGLRDEKGSAPFEYAGCTWLGTWQPAGESEDGIMVSPTGTVEDAGAATDAAGSDAGDRVYTFIDISYHYDYLRGIAFRCIAATIVLSVASAAVLWIAAGHLLRPVYAARKREQEFVISASHELKTPLMAMMANCDVLEAEAAGDGRLAPWIANIRSAADGMADCVATLLNAAGER